MAAQPDLHTHSTASDGSLRPAELVARAHAAGIEVLALTDHDTLSGLDDAMSCASGLGVELIPGVEISVTWGRRTIHVLGLRVDPESEMLRNGLARLLAYRAWRAEEIGRRLARAGIEGAYAGAAALSSGDLIGRTHFARYLASRGLAQDVRGVFKQYLVKGKPGYVPGDWASLEDALSWICAAGGQAVIAHPARYRFTRAKLLRLIGEFSELGGEGIEVVSGSHGRDDMLVFARHAREGRLYASSGSDYHGPETPWIELGRLPAVPPGCVPIWTSWPSRRLSRAASA
jgi:predicted metal-dependent phosphoesterase TrpH